jgi:bifunctional DNA-binding transcriptional regulator/antitoxin component of YhaV-PrlF toxin-antitoxin module
MRRTYKVQKIQDAPCITIKGKWLGKFGIGIGSRLELIEVDDMIVLMKIPDETAEREMLEIEARDLERRLNDIKRKLALC